MRRFLAILFLLLPVVASGCAGCSYGPIQPGGSGSEAVTIGTDGIQPANDNRYWNGQPMDTRKN